MSPQKQVEIRVAGDPFESPGLPQRAALAFPRVSAWEVPEEGGASLGPGPCSSEGLEAPQNSVVRAPALFLPSGYPVEIPELKL